MPPQPVMNRPYVGGPLLSLRHAALNGHAPAHSRRAQTQLDKQPATARFVVRASRRRSVPRSTAASGHDGGSSSSSSRPADPQGSGRRSRSEQHFDDDIVASWPVLSSADDAAPAVTISHDDVTHMHGSATDHGARDPDAAPAKPPPAGAVPTLMLTQFLYSSGTSMMSPTLPRIALDLGGSMQNVGQIYASHSLATAAGSTVLGRAADLIGPKRVLTLALLVTAAGNLAASTATSVPAFMAARAAAGLSGNVQGLVLTFIGRLYGSDSAARGIRVAQVNTVVSIAYIVCPAIGGLMFGISPMAPLVAMAALACLAAIMVHFVLPDLEPETLTEEQAGSEEDKGVEAAARAAALANARSDRGIQLILATALLGNMCMANFGMGVATCTSTLGWSPADRIIPSLYAMAGVAAVATSAVVWPAGSRSPSWGPLKVAVAAAAIRGLAWIALPFAIYATYSAALSTVSGALAIGACFTFAAAVGNTLVNIAQNVLLLEVLEQRHPNAIRGEVLSWLTTASMIGIIFGPVVVANLMIYSPVAGTIPFCLTGALSLLCSVALLFAGRSTVAQPTLA